MVDPTKNHQWLLYEVFKENHTLLLAQVYKQKDKFCSSALIFAGTANFFFPTWKLVVVTYSDRRQPAPDTWNIPKHWFLGFCSIPLLDLIFKGLN